MKRAIIYGKPVLIAAEVDGGGNATHAKGPV